MVFDRAAVIAPQRPRRVSTIKTSTSERDSLPKEWRAPQEEEALRRARQKKALIHFLLISFYICGKIDSDVSLKVILGALPPRVPCAFFLSAFLLGPAQIYFLFIFVLKNMRGAESRLAIPWGPARLSAAPLCTWRRVQRLLQLKRGVFRMIQSCDALLSGRGEGRC